MARTTATTTTDVSVPPPRLEPSAVAGLQLASLPPEIIERVLSLASLPAIVSANATARLFRGAPGGRSAVEHALRARARARGHARALPARLPVDACTWTDALMHREAILSLARSHAHAVATSGSSEDRFRTTVASSPWSNDHTWSNPVFSAFVDAEGGLHTCGEEEVRDEDGLGTGEYRATRAAGHSGDEVVPLPTRVASLAAVRVVAVAAGCGHLLALSDAGAVYACGENGWGQLGLGADADGTHALVPLAALDAEPAVGIGAGPVHSLALTASGRAYSWGNNAYGQLGHDDEVDRWEPTRIEALDGVRVGGVAGGLGHTLLLSTDGAVYSCGQGSLGHGGEREQLTPKRVEALAGVRAVHVSVGDVHSLVVDAAGSVHSFGHGDHGQLGHAGESSERAAGRIEALVPMRIEALAGVKAVRACAGPDSSAVLGADGSVHVFGDSSSGQICPPGPSGQMLPLRVQAFESARVLDCVLCDTHALYVTADGSVHACGKQSAALGLGASAGTEPEGLRWPPMRIGQLPPLQLGSRSAS